MNDRALLLTQYHQAKEKLNEELRIFKDGLRPFEGWKEIWQDQCNRIVESITAMRNIVCDLIATHRAYLMTLSVADREQALIHTLDLLRDHCDEACILLVAFAQNSRSLSEANFRKRLQVSRYLHHLVDEVQDVLDYRLPHSDEEAYSTPDATVVEADEVPNITRL